jgi:hypothetical protein
VLEVVSLLVVLVMSLIITRVATVALALTGMTQQAARFQARSALTGAGFTTTESERVVNHPVRRRVIMALMLIGNTGLVLAAALMVALLAGDGEGGLAGRGTQLGLLLAGLLALYAVARSAWLERAMARFIERVLDRHTDLGRRDFASLLRLGGDYRVVELNVQAGDWIAGRSLTQLQLNREGVLVLGVTRTDGTYLGAPRGDTVFQPGDIVMLYGRQSAIAELDQRRAGVGGQIRHAEAVAKQAEIEREGEATDDAPAGDRARDA